MIDTATGMKPGERYSVESTGREQQFSGFFLDGKYYLGPELLTAVGWLEGQTFIYDSLDPAGEPVFPDRVAGTISHLTLTLVDGASLALAEIAAEKFVEDAGPSNDDAAEQQYGAHDEALSGDSESSGQAQELEGRRTTRHNAKRILAMTAIAILSTCVVAFLRRERQ